MSETEEMLEKLAQYRQAMTESLGRSIARHPEYDPDKLRSDMQPIFDAIEQVSSGAQADVERTKAARAEREKRAAARKPLEPREPKGTASIEEFVEKHYRGAPPVREAIDRLLAIQRPAPEPESSGSLSDWVFESSVTRGASVVAPGEQPLADQEASGSNAGDPLGAGYCRFAVSSTASAKKAAETPAPQHASLASWIAASGVRTPAGPMPEQSTGTEAPIPARQDPAHRGFESWIAASSAGTEPTTPTEEPDESTAEPDDPAFGSFTR